MAAIDRSPPIDNLFALRRDPIGFLTRLVEEHGRDNALIRFSRDEGDAFYLVNDPEIIREVLVSREHDFGKWFHTALLAEIFSGGLVALGAEPHRKMRRMVQPAFHGRCLPHYAAQTVAIGSRERHLWPHDATFDLAPKLMRLTTSVIGRLIFGSDLRANGALERLCAALEAVLAVFGAFTVPAAEQASYDAARATFQEVLAGVVDRRRKQNAPAPEPTCTGESEAACPDLLDLLLAARWEGGELLTAQELDDQMRTILLAGQNTTSEALLWTIYLLANHPEAEGRVLAEIDDLLGAGGKGRPATFEDLPRLAYTHQIWQESLRLYPPIWLVAREAKADLPLGGEKIAAGSVLFLSPYLLHRDPRFWPDPECFRPERWASEESASMNPPRPRFSYFPFGGGSRRCLGEAVADMEGTLLLATILQTRRLRLAPQPPVRPRAAGFLLRSDRGLLVTAERR